MGTETELKEIIKRCNAEYLTHVYRVVKNKLLRLIIEGQIERKNVPCLKNVR